ncbi:TaqI-like C-terminal specificity domain-containing protein [Candidatus Parabeggiatoa sp. HSG14]|uniref:Eco57I restriction-modification methylase domain-containing protein n=1 Tax=Candidatus Parabeggiatoa sp. HSG14 TaxID=3055593 RepID=UPI0025A711E7|nr:TaqI-like C-terminal specificity domain-containing protein [Thiotrichales bacterium HSG14]
MSTLTKIQNLIKRFESQKGIYQQDEYSEAQTRIDFVNPFFMALGWDIDNKQRLAEPYRQVIYEDILKIDKAPYKRPDYSFRVGGVRKFFVEAKKPSINLKKNPEPAYQLRRYGWNAKLSLSIVTNFAEFAVYDCRIKPEKDDAPSVGRVLYLKYTDYLESWEELVKWFSFEAVWQGKFDQYAADKAITKGAIEVDTAFLNEMELWREKLAHHIFAKNSSLSQRQLNFVVQQTIDRIVFLRICEDRGIEDYGRLLSLTNGKNSYKRLFELFIDADTRYNSGLFHFKKEKEREQPDKLTPHLKIGDDVLQEIIVSLYYPKSPYEFSVLPADILGQVYERFLGKIIRLTNEHEAIIEEKPEVKKAGGVYYTPSYIVDYIVKQTLTPLLKGKKIGSRSTVNRLKVLDPACGSGSFLLGAYQFLLDWHLQQYLQNPEKWAKGKNPRLYQAIGKTWKLTVEERKRILLNNIYGVDIDFQAVEVTKLSLLLKVLEDEQSVISQLSLLKERVLPDIDNNIKCGNSLVSNNFYQEQLGLLNEETLYRINAFDWESEFSFVLKAGGFDAVIGNPPYGAFLSPEENTYLLNKFKLQNYQLDSYVLFIEQALFLNQKKGLTGLIIPNTWLLNLTYQRIRKHLFEQTTIRNIVHYQHRVFNQATVDTEIVIIEKSQPTDDHKVAITLIAIDKSSKNYVIPQNRWQSAEGKPVNIFEKPEFIGLADKLRTFQKLDNLCLITQGTKPFQVGKGKPPQTRDIVNQKPFVSETPLNETFRPLLRGSLIQKYQILWNDNYWISFGDWLAEPRYSANYDVSSKIVIRQTGDHLVATLDSSQFIVRDNLYTIVPRQNDYDLCFLLGIINSRLLQWFYANIINPEIGEALAQVKRGHLIQLPIAKINFDNPTNTAKHDKMTQLVEIMLTLNQKLRTNLDSHSRTALKRQIEATDRQIDNLVYQLYNLTAEEIVLIEKG